MALFGSKKDTDTKDQQSTESDLSDVSQTTSKKSGKLEDDHLYGVLQRPRITEKATILTDDNVYTFEVAPDANKIQIKQAVRQTYGVVPEKVRTVNMPYKKVRSRRGNPGTKGGGKKAYVYLKEGDSIDLI